MDINPSSGHMIIWSDDFDQNLVETKSFRCTFCKRGFSNAQALGGHMNIHRKDRAKLKEFSCENLLSLDITKNADPEDGPPPDYSASKRLSSENDQSDPDDKAENLDHIKENLGRRLPLFAEAPVNGGGRGEEAGGRFDKHVESRKVELINYGELDLELRLGPHEPQHAKSKP